MTGASRSRALPLLLAPLLLLPACADGGCPPLPDVPETVDLAGLLERIAPTKGEQAVLVNFWATWCGPCVAEMPELVKLYQETCGTDVRVQTVALDIAMPVEVDSVDGIARFAREKGFALPIVAFDGDMVALAEALDLPGAIPVTLAINAQGEAGRLEGAGRRKHFDRLIEKARGQ